MSKLSEDMDYVLAFVGGIIFSNALGAFVQGQYFMSVLSFLAMIVAVLLKKFVDWDAER